MLPFAVHREVGARVDGKRRAQVCINREARDVADGGGSSDLQLSQLHLDRRLGRVGQGMDIIGSLDVSRQRGEQAREICLHTSQKHVNLCAMQAQHARLRSFIASERPAGRRGDRVVLGFGFIDPQRFSAALPRPYNLMSFAHNP